MNTDQMLDYTHQRHAELVAEANTARLLAESRTKREPLRHRLAVRLHHLADTIDARPPHLA